MTPLLALALMFLGPLVGGLLVGLLQLGIYRLLRRPADQTPAFFILFARGLLAVFVVVAVLAILTRSFSH
jgi:hypothetical protein